MDSNLNVSNLKRWHVYFAVSLFSLTTLLIGLPNAVALLNGGLISFTNPETRVNELNATLNRLTSETKNVAEISTDNATQISNLLLLVNRNISDLRDVVKRLAELERKTARIETKTGD